MPGDITRSHSHLVSTSFSRSCPSPANYFYLSPRHFVPLKIACQLSPHEQLLVAKPTNVVALNIKNLTVADDSFVKSRYSLAKESCFPTLVRAVPIPAAAVVIHPVLIPVSTVYPRVSHGILPFPCMCKTLPCIQVVTCPTALQLSYLSAVLACLAQMWYKPWLLGYTKMPTSEQPASPTLSFLEGSDYSMGSSCTGSFSTFIHQ